MQRTGGALRRVLALLLCVMLGCGAFAGCSQMDDLVSNVTATGEFPVDVNGVTISARPSRAVVLSPSLADVLLALDCETQLVGAADSCTQEGLEELTKVPAGDVEAIQGLQPDLVLLDGNSGADQNALEEAGLTVLAVEPATDRSDFERLYSQVSSAFSGGGPGYDEGISTAQDIFSTLDDINRVVPTDRVTTACYLYDLDGSAVTGDMFGSTIMSYAGVTNAFDSQEGGTYEFRVLELANPNVIFCAPGLKAQLESDSRFAGLQAVQEGRVFELDESLMEWQGRTVVEAAYEICASAFPELLEPSSMEVSDPTTDIDSEVSSVMDAQARYNTLEEGDQGDDVAAIQERLAQLGYLTGSYDGHYGSTTTNCVAQFQLVNNLDSTGIADPATQAALFAEGALRPDGTPLPEEAGADSSASSSSSDASSSSGSSSSQVPQSQGSESSSETSTES